MRVYLQSHELGKALAKGLLDMGKTQQLAAKELNVTQGQISHLISGDFKTRNNLVLKVCKYANVNPDEFKPAPKSETIDREAIIALERACGGQRRKTAVVIRVLRALETLDPAN